MSKAKCGLNTILPEMHNLEGQKLVSFLSNNNVGWSEGMTVQRRAQGKSTCDSVDAPHAQADYVAKYNAVNRNDWDSAYYLTTIRTN
jgi:hypothetical protein